jgi:hypothetical protein
VVVKGEQEGEHKSQHKRNDKSRARSVRAPLDRI